MTNSQPTPDPRSKTHCKRGHDLAKFGTRHKNGGRDCAECARIRNRVDYVPDQPARKPVDQAEVIRMYQDGVPVRDIVKQMGMSTATVYRIIRKAGVPTRNAKQAITSADIEAVWAELMSETGEDSE